LPDELPIGKYPSGMKIMPRGGIGLDWL
jgi:hypothetical protein